MFLRWLFIHVSLAASLLAAAPHGLAQLYRWTDERGVVNYSDRQPASRAGVEPASIVADRLSVYSPDTALLEAMSAARHEEREAEKRNRIGRELKALRASTGVSAPASPDARPCITSAGCSSASGEPTQLLTPAMWFAPRRRAPVLQQAQLPPGVTAGNVNAGQGYVAGNSAAAARPAPSPQPVLVRPLSEERRTIAPAMR
jgi:hypothetical protein